MVRFLQIFALWSVLAVACLGEDFAERLFKAGQKAEKAGDTLHAFLLYSQAASLQPANPDYAMRKAALQADAAMSASTHLDTRALETESSEVSVEPLLDTDVVEARGARLPSRLKGPRGLK